MKPKRLSCAALVLLAGTIYRPAWTQPATGEAKQWLQRMAQATQTLNYQGTFIYAQGPHLEAMRIVHGSNAKGERQRVFSLSGAPREVVLDSGSVTCFLPKRQAKFHSNRHQRSHFPLPIPIEIGRIEGHYELQMLGTDRIAGLSTRIVAIKPRDQWRFGYRFWLDERNGMVLRAVLLDENSYPLEQLMFTEFEIKPEIADADFATPALAPDSAHEESAAPPNEEPLQSSAWRIGRVPDGFIKVLHNRLLKNPEQQATEHLVFSDGLATVSIFLEKLGERPTSSLQGATKLGSINAFGRSIAGHQVLVVGEVPAATVQHIVDAIEYDPKQAQELGR